MLRKLGLTLLREHEKLFLQLLAPDFRTFEWSTAGVRQGHLGPCHSVTHRRKTLGEERYSGGVISPLHYQIVLLFITLYFYHFPFFYYRTLFSPPDRRMCLKRGSTLSGVEFFFRIRTLTRGTWLGVPIC